MYYLLETDCFQKPEPFRTRDADAPWGYGASDWIRGRLMKEPAKPIEMELWSRGGGSGMAELFLDSIPLFRDDLVDALVQAGVDNLQAFPAVLNRPDGRKVTNYKAGNILGLLKCADLGKSQYEDHRRHGDDRGRVSQARRRRGRGPEPALLPARRVDRLHHRPRAREGEHRLPGVQVPVLAQPRAVMGRGRGDGPSGAGRRKLLGVLFAHLDSGQRLLGRLGLHTRQRIARLLLQEPAAPDHRQALLRNPLADSFVLRVSGGAALGGTLSLALGGAALAERLGALAQHLAPPLDAVAGGVLPSRQ